MTTVKNQGNGNAEGFYLSVYLSPDSIITPWDDGLQMGDLEIGSVYVSALAAGAQQTLTINCTVPSTLAGTFYLGTIADSRNNVIESNESNNSLAGGRITIAK
jgi:subtilase family serine protease